MQRRDFIKSLTLASVGAGLAMEAQKPHARSTVSRPMSPDMPYRDLGRTVENVSLIGLGVDMIDLVQIHEVIRMGDPEAVFAPGGAVEAARAAQKTGKLRYIGFTGHKDPSIHFHMINYAEQHASTSTRCRCRSVSWMRTSVCSSTKWCRSRTQGRRCSGDEDLRLRGDTKGESRRANRNVALFDELADFGRDYRHGYDGAARAGSDGREDFHANGPAAGCQPSRTHQRCCGGRQVRVAQDKPQV
jgi:hypothetical protein